LLEQQEADEAEAEKYEDGNWNNNRY
jgi:hypothetical protein